MALVAGGAGLKIAHGSPCDSRAVGGDKGYLAPSGRLSRALLTSQHLLSRVERLFSRRSFDRLSLCILLILPFCDGTLVPASADQHSLKRRNYRGRLSTHSTHLPTQHPCSPIQNSIASTSTTVGSLAEPPPIFFPGPTSAPQPYCAAAAEPAPLRPCLCPSDQSRRRRGGSDAIHIETRNRGDRGGRPTWRARARTTAPIAKATPRPIHGRCLRPAHPFPWSAIP